MKAADKSLDSVGKSAETATSSIVKIASGIGVFKAVSAGVDLIKSSVSGAVSRIDTLNNANRVFQNMGFSTKDTKAAMDALNKSIKGMPTALNDGVQGMEMLASSMGDIGKAQQVFSALNDGILGFGGTTDQVSGAVRQLSQAFAGGKVDAETWNSMLDSGLGPALNAIAKQMGITTAALKDGLSKGKISVGQFQDALISLDQNGGGGLASLHQIAQDALGGISTSMTNAKTAVTRGVATIIGAIDKGLAANKLPGIAASISTAGSMMETALNAVAGAVPNVITKIVTLTHGLIPLAPAIKVVSTAMAVFVASIAASSKIVSTITMFEKFGQGLTSIGGAIAKIGGPMGALIAVMLALGAAFAFIYSKSAPLQQAVSRAGQAIGAILAPAIKTVTNGVSSFIDGLNNAGSSATNLTQQVGGVLANAINSINWTTVGSLAQSAFSVIGKVVTGVVVAFKSIVQAVNEVAQGFASVGGVSSVWSIIKSVVMGLGPIFQTIGTTVTGVVQAFTGASSATTTWITLGQVIGTIANVLAAIVPTVMTVTTSIISFVGQLIVSIANGISNLNTMITNAMTTIWATIQPVITAIGVLWTALQPIITTVWTVISTNIGTAMNIIMTIIQTVLSVISTYWNATWSVIGTVVSTVWSVIVNSITTFMNVISGIITAVMDVIHGDWSGAWNAIKGVADAAWNGIKTNVTTVINAVKSVITSVLNAIKSIWTSVWNGIKSVATTVWNAIKSAISSAINAVKSVITGVMSSITSAMTSAWNAIKSATISAWNGVKSAVSNGVSGAVSAVKGFVSDMINAGKDLVNGLIKGITGMVKNVISAAKDLAGKAVNAVKGALKIGSPSKVMAKMGMWTGAGFVNGIDSMIKPVDRMASRLSDAAVPEISTVDFTPTFDTNSLNSKLQKASSMMSDQLNSQMNSNLELSNAWTVEIPVNLDSNEIARVTAKPMQNELDRLETQYNRVRGQR